MTKANIIQQVAEETGISKVDVSEVFESIFSRISTALERQERVDIRKFGNFSVKHYPPRKAMNPATQEEISLPSRYVPQLKFSQFLKEKINSANLRGF